MIFCQLQIMGEIEVNILIISIHIVNESQLTSYKVEHQS